MEDVIVLSYFAKVNKGIPARRSLGNTEAESDAKMGCGSDAISKDKEVCGELVE